MDRGEMIALIRDGVPEPGGTWAELGAGTGNFTLALAELLGVGGQIYAVDRDGRAIDQQRQLAGQRPFGVAIHPVQSDFTRSLRLPLLDGVLMANALHFVREQQHLLGQVAGYVRPAGRLLVVEYELDAPLRYVPYPVSFARCAELALAAGWDSPARIATRRSPSTGMSMYAALALRAT